MSFRIVSTGSYVPENTIDNFALSEIMDTNDEWITQRVGIKERHISINETTSDMAYQASLKALEAGNTAPGEIDMIICATISAEHKSPNLACMVQKKLGASCPCLDVNCACSSFIYALDTAAGFFARKKVRKMLLVGAERISGIIDWNDRSTAVIFGDGAGAVLLEEGDNYLASRLTASGNDEIIRIPNYAGDSPFYKGERENPYIMMNGQETFKFAVKSMCRDIQDVAGQAGIPVSDIDWVVPHQANSRIIDFAKKKLDIPQERFLMNINKFGNTSSASIPMMLDQLNSTGNLKRGDNVAMCAFGGGLSSAACIIRW